MTQTTYDKTEKGREEISTRKHRLASRLRTLLVLVDGKQTKEELLNKVAGLGLNEESIAELLDNGFIESHVVQAESISEVSPSAETPASTAAETQAVATNPIPEGQTQYEAIYHFYTETIKSTIGLRGYGLQLKVEKASSIEDFRALRQPYLEAVLKAQGNEMARSLRDRLDQLLYYGEQSPHTTISKVSTTTE